MNTLLSEVPSGDARPQNGKPSRSCCQVTPRRAAGIVGVVIAILAAAAGLRARNGNSHDGPEVSALTVETVQIERTKSWRQRRHRTGVVAAERTSELSFERAGRVIQVLVKPGAKVTAGQAVARLDQRQLRTKRREIQAQEQQAQAVLDELRAGPRKESIAAAQAEVRNLQAQVDSLAADLPRTRLLLKRGVITKAQFEKADYGLRSARAQLDASQRRLDELKAGSRPEKIDAAQAAVARLQAALAELAVHERNCVLTAPFAGTITRRYVDEGAVVSPGAAVARLVETDRLEARIGLPPRLAATLEPEQRHQVTAGGLSIPATVQSIAGELDAATRTRLVVFTLDESAAGQVTPGEMARIELAQAVETSEFRLPRTALYSFRKGLWTVLAVADVDGRNIGVIQPRVVEILNGNAEHVLVRGTLKEGEFIVSTGVHRLALRQKVKVKGQGKT